MGYGTLLAVFENEPTEAEVTETKLIDEVPF